MGSFVNIYWTKIKLYAIFLIPSFLTGGMESFKKVKTYSYQMLPDLLYGQKNLSVLVLKENTHL